MDILVIVGVLFLLMHLRFPPRGQDDLIQGVNKESTDTLKGIAAVFVVLGHLLQSTNDGFLADSFKRVGMYAVCVFFVFSGYGLLTSYKRSEGQLIGYWKKRIATVLLPYLVFTVLYIGLRLLLGENLTVAGVALSFVNGSPMVRYSWFVEVILLYYLVFYICAKFAQKDLALLCFCVSVFSALFVIGMKKLGFESFWYNTIFCFVIGLIWARKSSAIEQAMHKHWFVYFAGTGVVYAAVFYCTRVLWLWGELGECLVTSVFCVLVLITLYRVRVQSSAVTRFIGTISFEIYLCHGGFLMIFTRVPAIYNNPLLLGTAVMVCTLVSAWILHPILNRVGRILIQR